MQVHILLGAKGSIGGDNCAVPSKADDCASSPDDGAMGDIRASPNDPAFIHHHAMIDFIFEMWLKDHSDVSYRGPSNNPKFPGQAAGDCAVPFMPAFTHSEAFKPADTFGYSYEDLDNSTHSSPSSVVMVSVPMIVTGIVLTLITILV